MRRLPPEPIGTVATHGSTRGPRSVAPVSGLVTPAGSDVLHPVRRGIPDTVEGRGSRRWAPLLRGAPWTVSSGPNEPRIEGKNERDLRATNRPGVTAIFALAGALVIGASDFGGGVAARQASPVRVAAWVQASSLGLVAIAVWFVDAPEVRSVDIGAGVVAGLSGTFSFVALYAAFARGQISLLAPVTAVVGAVIPTLVGVVRGESLAGLHIVGIVIALGAIGLVTSEEHPGAEASSTPPAALALALIAGAGFSVFFLALAETQPEAGFWPLVAARVVSVPVVIIVAKLVTGGISMPRAMRGVVFLAGLGEAISNVFAMWAFQRGPLAVAAVLGAFYPVSTVLLARLILDERLRRLQWFGVAMALVAIPLIAIP